MRRAMSLNLLKEVKNKEILPYLRNETEKMMLPSLAVEINKARIEGRLTGKTPQERYQSFFKASRNNQKIFTSYPRLKTSLNHFVKTSIDSAEEMLAFLEKNQDNIKKFFNIPQSSVVGKISFPLNGDRHYKGKQTACVKIGRKKLIIKYTSLNTSKLWEFIVNLANKEFFLPNLETAKTLLIDGVEVREYVKMLPARNENEVKDFYLRLGKIIACAYLLNGIDFHMDNIVACKDHPHLIDTETFLTNFEALGIKKWKNLYTTGFLKIKKSKLGDVSGISGGKVPRISLFDAYPINDKTDHIRVGFRKTSQSKPHNLPVLSGKTINPKKYQKELIEGFSKTYAFFLKEKKALKKEILHFVNSQEIASRQIIRTTSVYAFLITSLFQPSHLKLSNPKKEVENYLKKGYGNKQEKVKKLINYEIIEILNLNIPLFYSKAGKKHLYSDGKAIWRNYFSKTASQYIENKINSLSEKDLKKKIKEIKLASSNIKK